MISPSMVPGIDCVILQKAISPQISRSFLYLSQGVQWPIAQLSHQVVFKLSLWKVLYLLWQPVKELNGNNRKTFLGPVQPTVRHFQFCNVYGFDADEWHFWFFCLM